VLFFEFIYLKAQREVVLIFEEPIEKKGKEEEKLFAAKEIARTLLQEGIFLKDVEEATGLSQEDARQLLH